MNIFKKALDYLTGKQELLNTLQQQSEAIQTLTQNTNKKEEKPCLNRVVYNVNTGNVNVINCDGDSFTGFNIAPEVVEKLKYATSNELIIKLLTPEQEKVVVKEDTEKQEKELVSNFLDIFKNNKDFEVEDGELWFKGIYSVSIPSIIVAAFVELLQKKEEYEKEGYTALIELQQVNEQYQSLKAFTAKLLTSPRQESIEQVLNFCRHNDMRISKRGNIIAYRRVREFTDVSMPDNLELAAFVKESIAKVKKWKQSPKNYFVSFDDENTKEYKLTKHEFTEHSDLGNLFDLYNNQSILKPETTKLYSSQHDYGKYQFAIGDVYKADEGDIDVNAGQCHSGGLHFASVSYNYEGYGEIPIVVLINPAKTITIPLNETAKGRTTEMKIACINPNEHGIHIDETLIEEADEQYDEYTLEELQQVISQKTLKPLSVEEEVTILSIPEVVNIREILSKKVISF